MGDTINTASRMESNGFPMAVHVSQDVYDDIEDETDKLSFHSLGERTIKGKGIMHTHLLKVISFQVGHAMYEGDKGFFLL